MRATNFAVAALLLAVAGAAPATAQRRVGPVVVASRADVEQREYDLVEYQKAQRWGFGAHAELSLGSRSALVVESLELERGAEGRAAGSLGGGLEGSLTTDVRLRYVEVPVLLRWELLGGAVRPYLAAGASLGYLEKATVRTEVDGGSEKQDITGDLRRWDVSAVAAVGVWAQLGQVRCFVEGRFTHGLRNLDPSGETRLENRSLGVLAGVTFRLGGRS